MTDSNKAHFDTTLRDAEQTQALLTVEEELEIAQQLARLSVDIIEAGFPLSSNEDFEAVRRIAHEVETHGLRVGTRLAQRRQDRLERL